MFLHEINDFRSIINNTSATFNIRPDIIEKDYYTFMILKDIVSKQGDEVVFKGGTSLSKAYGVINRMSEDIDLCLPKDKIKSGGARKRLITAIVSSMSDLNLKDCSLRGVEYHGVYNDIRGEYVSCTPVHVVEPHIKVETALRFEEYPVEERVIDSYVGQYLRTLGLDIQFDLQPFTVLTVSIYRTFVDKLFALGDYYLMNNVTRYSRHLYDLYKLICYIDFSNQILVNDILSLIVEVRNLRKDGVKCLSSQDGVDLKQVLNDALNSDFYREDFNTLTKMSLFENVTYEQCDSVVQNFINIYL